MKNNIAETITTILLIAIAVLLLNPFHFWMPDMMVVVMLVCLLGLFAIFASFILRETSIDEREVSNRALAGRNAYLVGSGILIVAIMIQGYNHLVDPWLILALLGMIVAKISTRIWSDKNR
jgi:hypothetical protein